MRRLALLGVVVAVGVAPGAALAAPLPCGGVPQVTDASGDGHHATTDVVSAWFSEDAGGLQAVIKVRGGDLLPEHGDADVNGTALALLYRVGGQLDYVRVRVPPPGGGDVVYDHGTYSDAGGFAGAGATAGSIENAGAGATVTIDLPAAQALSPGTVLAGPFALTYDGISSGVPDWVDHAPGGTAPADSARGADYVVGSCNGGGDRTVAVSLDGPASLKSGRKARISGAVSPARAGVPVQLALSGGKGRTLDLTTDSDGRFSAKPVIDRTTDARATAEGIGSQTITVIVRSTVSIEKDDGEITGRVRPAGPGRVLLLPAGSVEEIDSKRIDGHRFSFRLGDSTPRGRVQAVYIPARERAERSVSNTLRLR